MNIALTLNATIGTLFDPRAAHTLAWALILALADVLCTTKRMNSQPILPIFTTTSVKLLSEIEQVPDFFDSVETYLSGLNQASALLGSAEHLLKTSLVDRLVMPDARLPVPILYSPELDELLRYDTSKDLIQCQIPNWAELVRTNLKTLKALAAISSAGLTPELELDGNRFELPEIRKTVFSHGFGAGCSVVSNCCVTGLYIVAKQVEVQIKGLKAGCVLRAQLSDAARLAVADHRPPFKAALKYAEATRHLPLLPHGFKGVVIEQIWNFEEQAEIEFA